MHEDLFGQWEGGGLGKGVGKQVSRTWQTDAIDVGTRVRAVTQPALAIIVMVAIILAAETTTSLALGQTTNPAPGRGGNAHSLKPRGTWSEKG